MEDWTKSGWIKSYRKFKNWEWYKTPNMFHLFHHMLFEANRADGKWQGKAVKRGQLIIGRKTLSKDTGISEQSVRTCLEKLKSTGEITIQPTNKYSIITICNYDIYQPEDKDSNQQVNQQPNHQLTSNQPATNHKQEYKEEKNSKKSIKENQKENFGNFEIQGDMIILPEGVGAKPITDFSFLDRGQN